jgi:outer membrane biogenesis lipoprotein LolB
MNPIRTITPLAVLLLLTACAAPGSRLANRSQATANSGEADFTPRYEHALVLEYSDGATPFLRLTEIPGR